MSNITAQQKVSIQSPYDIVCQLYNAGRHLIHTGGGDNGKKPVIPHWAEYQNHRPTGAELYEWQQKYNPTVWAVVCGGDEYWMAPWGEYRCYRCHPQPGEGNK